MYDLRNTQHLNLQFYSHTENKHFHSRFQNFAVMWILYFFLLGDTQTSGNHPPPQKKYETIYFWYSFFWMISWRLNFKSWRFETHFCSETSVYKLQALRSHPKERIKVFGTRRKFEIKRNRVNILTCTTFSELFFENGSPSHKQHPVCPIVQQFFFKLRDLRRCSKNLYHLVQLYICTL